MELLFAPYPVLSRVVIQKEICVMRRFLLFGTVLFSVLSFPVEGAVATGVNFGVLLDGVGTVWLSGVRFEVVENTLPVTDIVGTPSEPANLDFQSR